MKKILVIHHSQSGQLTQIINNITNPLQNENTQVDYLSITMEKPFPFPWSKSQFFGVFPQTFLQIPEKTKPIPEELLNTKYDLIILGYTIWYLTPSLPTTSFLNTPQAAQLLKNTPVITVIGCRNMWVMAQEKIKKQLQKLQAKLVGNIVLADRHLNHISVITISKWMFTGKKDRFLGIFPKPGISKKDITEASKFAPIINKHLQVGNFKKLQQELLQAKAVTIKPFLVLTDKRANIIFSKWANLIQKKGFHSSKRRAFWVKFFNYYLLFAIWVIAPIVFILFLLTYIPLYKKIQSDKKYYSSVQLKDR